MKALIAIFMFLFGIAVAIAALWAAPNGIASIAGLEWRRVTTPYEEDQPKVPSVKRDRALKLLAESAVERILFDPFSAVFDDLKIIRKEKEKEIVCGSVNAKNRMGAYVGRQSFAYELLLDYAVVASGFDKDEEKKIAEREISKMCNS